MASLLRREECLLLGDGGAGCQGRTSHLQPHGTTGNQWAWEPLSFPQYPHLLASGVAPIGQAVSSNESRGVCQALETEWGKCTVCVPGSPPSLPQGNRGCPRAP